MTPQAQWSSDPTQRSVGTITLTTPNGAKIDMITSNAIRSGEIAGYLSMRDQVLTQAQTQVDSFAAAIAGALSDVQTAGTPVTSGAQSGFDVDASTLAPDDSIDFSFLDPGTAAARRMSFVAVSDPAAAGPTSDPDVFGIDLSGGPGSIAAQMNAALARHGISVSNPAGGTIRLLSNSANSEFDLGWSDDDQRIPSAAAYRCPSLRTATAPTPAASARPDSRSLGLQRGYRSIPVSSRILPKL